MNNENCKHFICIWGMRYNDDDPDSCDSEGPFCKNCHDFNYYGCKICGYFDNMENKCSLEKEELG